MLLQKPRVQQQQLDISHADAACHLLSALVQHWHASNALSQHEAERLQYWVTVFHLRVTGESGREAGRRTDRLDSGQAAP